MLTITIQVLHFLIKYLVTRKTDATGTFRKNRKGVPKEVVSSKLKKGEISVRFRKKLMVLRWKDMKDVYIMSTVHGPGMATITARGGIQKQKPKACIDYKDIMKGADLMDQFLATTNCAKSYLKKYCRKICLRFLDIAVLNAFVIHKELNGRYTFLQFKLKLISSIFEKYGRSTNRREIRGRPSWEASPERLAGRHFLEESPINGPRHLRRQYVVCAVKNNKERKIVQFLYKQCKVYLCPTRCFELHHTKINFSE